MLRLLADQNVNERVIRGLRSRLPSIDLVRAFDEGLSTIDDRSLLRWAAAEVRVLLTMDRRTMTLHAYERVEGGETMPGVLQLRPGFTVREVIEDLILIVTCCDAGELNGQVRYVPLAT